MEFKENDFIKVNFTLYANKKPVMTTYSKIGEEMEAKAEKYEPKVLILGKSFILKAFDDEILKGIKKTKIILTCDNAYGRRKKELLKTFPKTVFSEHDLKVVPGVTYDFNGMNGIVKSVVGGRVLVDFNNPLSNKNIEIDYEVMEKIEDFEKKILIVLSEILKIPRISFKFEKKEDKKFILKLDEQIFVMKEQILKSLKEFIKEINNYSIKIESFKKE